MSTPVDPARAESRANADAPVPASPEHEHHRLPHVPEAIRHPHLPEGKSTPPIGLVAVQGAGSISSATVGLLMIIGSILVFIDAAGLKEASDPLGPRAVPILVGSLLAVLGVLLVLRYIRPALRYLRAGAALDHGPRLLAVAAMVVLIIGFALLLPVLGYVVTSALLFAGAALLLNGPRRWQLLLYGWILAAVVFLIFDRLIGLSLPVGPWGF